jgi:hypothetical protein
VTGVNLTSATYGSGQYGSQTYGTVASDPVASLRYRLVPWPAGYLTDPAWQYRQGDTRPQFKAAVLGSEGPLQLVGVSSAVLALSRMSEHSEPARLYPLTVEGPTTAGNYWLSRTWQPGDLASAGVYRAGVAITYSSGRRLSVPIDDRQVFVITENRSTARWSDPTARWGTSEWS